MKTLHLTLKKNWFDMIASGLKKEEYREIKPYWTNRLLLATNLPEIRMKTPSGELCHKSLPANDGDMFQSIIFTNGYRKDSPSCAFYCDEITIGYGKPEWGAPSGELVYIIKIGDRICCI